MAINFMCRKRIRLLKIILFFFCFGLGASICVKNAEASEKVTTYIEAHKAFKSGQYEKAEEGLKKVLDVYPKHAYAQKDLGLTLIFLNRPDEALVALKQTITLSPKTKLSLEAGRAARFILSQKRGLLSQFFTLRYMYDDNVTLYPEEDEDPLGRYDSISLFRYMPQLKWYVPGMKGLNTFSLAYMIDSRFYHRKDERDLQIHLFMATWQYSLGLSRLTFLANQHTSNLHYDRYTHGPGIGVTWAYDLTYQMMIELGSGYDWQIRTPDRTKNKETIKGSAKLRFYLFSRSGYFELEYSFRDDKEKDGLEDEQKAELTVGRTSQYEMNIVIPKSFLIPFGHFISKGNWSSHYDFHSFSYVRKNFNWYLFEYLGGSHRKDKTFIYEFRHIHSLYRKKLNNRKRFETYLELKYTHRKNNSNINNINPILEDKDYHRNIYALGLNFEF